MSTTDRTTASASNTARRPIGEFPFICLEGIDGVGKTTVARAVATRLKGLYIKTPPPPFSRIRADIDGRASPAARFHFYLASVVFTQETVVSTMRKRPVVCDRYIHSTLAYHAAMGAPVSDLAQAGASIANPDACYLLVADETVRLARLARRNRGRLDALEADSSFMAEVQSQLRSYHLHEIDTSDLTPEEVVAMIVSDVATLPCSTRAVLR